MSTDAMTLLAPDDRSSFSDIIAYYSGHNQLMIPMTKPRRTNLPEQNRNPGLPFIITATRTNTTTHCTRFVTSSP
ncbi:hypothetical protein VTJ04DRAFT_1275 [Mycothermus thermophilus]|uniref:uncharacterized protein n=1 Tax=Humicola insolens TaxID=85995 RepID=UPI0037420F89